MSTRKPSRPGGAHQAGWPHAALILIAPLLLGGSWHQYDKLVCSDCHTMHNSAAGQAMRYDLDDTPAQYLLRSSSPDTLCLHCHGAMPVQGAPGVTLQEGGMPPFDSAAGFFSTSGSGGQPVIGLGHVIGVAPTEDPATYFSSTAMTLGCLSCHDQHGSALYRNLRPGPSGRGGSASPLVTERVLAGQGAGSTVYGAANVRYQSGFTEWCLDCHDQYSHYHLDVTFEARPDLFSYYSANALSTTGAQLPRPRVQTPILEAVPDPTNQLFCLSCHKAHGSGAPRGVVYPDPADSSSLCARCHVPPAAVAP